MIQKRKRCFLLLVFLSSCAGIGLIIAAAATDFWLTATPVRKVDKATSDAAAHLNESTGTKFMGKVNMGLFHGMKVLDNGLGSSGRSYEIWITGNFTSNQPFNTGLWIACLLFLALAISWGLISSGFALLNMNRKPVETISGPMGLYLWNLLAVICEFIAIMMYMILFYLYFAESVMTTSERSTFNWSSKNVTWFGYSFYIAVGALAPFLLNMLLVYCSGSRVELGKHRDKADGVPMDRVMMY